ncbi:MAG: PbsX family transcriptional regulator [Gammaproteobacteria bacterium]|nr:PbsX family transcriptional regulator [Gammaproteobacteria bacterium]
MITVDIRKQGGAAVMTIPASILKMLNIAIGSKLEIDIRSGAIVATPAEKKPRKRYSLDELLQSVRPEQIKLLNAETTWARDGKSKGREIP